MARNWPDSWDAEDRAPHLELSDVPLGLAVPFTGQESILDGVKAMYPDESRGEQIRSADFTEAWIGNGMMNGILPARARIDGDILDVEVLGFGHVQLPLDRNSLEGLEP